MNLFLRSDLETIDIYDCGKVDDYIRIFSVVPNVQNLNLRNAGQFKDEVIDYIMERDSNLKNLQLEAANLVTNDKWMQFFMKCGELLESLKLSWLDYSMDDVAFRLVSSAGSRLRTLSLEGFTDADDEVLSNMHTACTQLNKLRFTENDTCTDEGFAALFTEWSNPPLAFIDLSSNRSVDYSAPDGPDEPVGLASKGFEALMNHSGSRIERLDISSCRHITYESFSNIFNGKKQYPCLKDVNISFQTKVDTSIVAGMFRSCPVLIKVTAFGCFNVVDVAVPKGVALIGVPNAQDALVKEGDLDADLW
ncbi:hypothetical protein P7C71_g100, partial [Lecanoromycetidae sp. Uapishka_2]